MKSFELNINENFLIFVHDKNDVIKSIFSTMQNLSNPKFWDHDNNIKICFLICCFFITICLKQNVWEIICKKNIFTPCCDYIKKFIYDTFNKKYFALENYKRNININIEENNLKEENDENTNTPNELNENDLENPDKTQEKSEEEKDRLRRIVVERFKLVKLLAKILGYMAKENTFERIYHIQIFREIFPFVLDLFHVDYTEINYEIYSILNVCTYFKECKLYLYVDKKKTFDIIKKDLFSRINYCLQKYNYLKESILSNEKMKKLATSSNKENLENEDIQNNILEKLKLYEAINFKSRIFARLNFREFTILLKILCNMLVMNNFNTFKSLLFDCSDIDLESFKKQIAEFVEDFDDRSNKQSRVVDFEQIVHPGKIFLMILEPFSKFHGIFFLI